MVHSKLFGHLVLLGGLLHASVQAQSLWPIQSFQSTSVRPPSMNVTKHGKTEIGSIFISPINYPQPSGYPMIYSDDGQLVWQGPETNISAFQPGVLHSEPVLAYWEGFNSNQGYGFGSIKILNSSYQEIYDVAISGEEHNFVTGFGPMSSYIDLHESHITEEGTILVTAVNVTRADMSPVGGPKNGWVRDGLFYEIDIQSNDIIFRWSALEHLSDIPMANAEVPPAGKGHSMSDPWDYAHLNSVAKYGENFLVSSRHTCSIFLVGKNGHVIWQLHAS
jgi:hypothetical protein